MWIDSDRYKHPEILKEFASRLQADLADMRAQGHDPIKTACQILKFDYPELYPELQYASNSPEYHHPEAWEDKPNPKESWYGEAIYLDGKIAERWSEHWKRSSEFVTQIPGILQTMVNFIKPYGKLPVHDDRGGWERIDRWTGKRQRGFTVSIGLDVPSSDPEVCGLTFDGEARGQKNGEWIVFEGRNCMHSLWNNSNQWRVAAVVDIQASEFNLLGYSERLTAIWDKEDQEHPYVR